MFLLCKRAFVAGGEPARYIYDYDVTGIYWV